MLTLGSYVFLPLSAKKHKFINSVMFGIAGDFVSLLFFLLFQKGKYGLNVCGEGGEYETFTLDCPLFKKRIVM